MSDVVVAQRDGQHIAYANSTIVVAHHATERLGGLLRETWPHAARVFLITDTNVAATCALAVERSIRDSGITVSVRAIPAGETSKSLDEAGRLYDWLADQHAERSEPIVALGGGVVGDLAGFVAATYLRGVPLAQVPTSLLAMVDSSVGGKTGVNLSAGKNLVGAFYAPTLVSVDPALLATLPPRELRSGWAEVIKYAFIEASVPGAGSAMLHQCLGTEGAALRALELESATRVIERCIELKARVVALDEREAGLRRILNLGHTLGHAIEVEAGYGWFAHGEAVALGLLAVARIAHRLRHCDASVPARVDALLADFSLPRSLDGLPASSLIGRTRTDKKAAGGRVTWVLPAGIDRVTTSADVADALVAAVLVELGATPP